MKSFLRKMQFKWKVSPRDTILILTVFAITGTTTAWLSRFITRYLVPTGEGFLFWTVKLTIILLGYQLLLLVISVPFGQFPFFRRYLTRLFSRLFRWKSDAPKSVDRKILDLPPMKSIAIFASGAGSNAREIIRYFRNHPSINISLIVTNKPEAGVVQVAAESNLPVLIIEKERFFRGDAYVPELQQAGIDFIVLAGFLWKVPDALVAVYRNQMINIHPALLPAYGGKGMYGNRVHEAVISAGELKSGISIHYVDEVFDHGKVLFQASCEVRPDDTPASLAERIHGLEHANYPKVIEQLLDPKSTLNTDGKQP